MVEDDVSAIRGVGARELLPKDGMPFALETGLPADAQREITALKVRDALALVKWDYDPVQEEITSGRVTVSRFFEHMDWR